MPTPHRPIPSALRFFSLTALGLAVIECLVRLTPVSRYGFWREVESTVSEQPIDMLFVGSSCVAAAIDTDAARECFPNKPAIRIINAGAGYSTSAERFLALRNSLKLHAPRLRNCTLFLEAEGHGPDSAIWSYPWSHSERSDILAPLLRAEDITRYWNGPHAFEEKLKLTVDWLLQPWATYSRALTVGRQRSALPQKYLGPVLEKLLLRPAPFTPTTPKLTNAGGIRSDDEGIALARDLARKFAEKMLRDQKPIDWPSTIVADIVRLAQSHDLQVIFFAPPQHSLLRSISETNTRRNDRENFDTLCKEWGTPLLEPDFPITDVDFPDIWHLQSSRAPAYTKALMEAWQGLRRR